jgi:hypothetical protein
MSRSSNRTVRLNVEGFERRDTPATTVSLSGHVLAITGDNAANNVVVTVNDQTNDIQVVADGQTSHFQASQISTFNIALKGGDDYLEIDLGNLNASSASLTRALTINTNLGAGNDTAFYTFGGLNVPGREIDAALKIITHAEDGNDSVIGNFGTIGAATTFQSFLGNGDDEGFAGIWGNINATMTVDLHGEAGNDSLNAFATFQNGNYNNINIGAGGFLNVDMNGGDGNDTMNTTYGGVNRGAIRVRENGAAGDDQVTGTIQLNRPIFPIPTGFVDVVLSGGTGNDKLNLSIEGRAVKFRGEIDGGAGTDSGTGTSNIEIINCNP